MEIFRRSILDQEALNVGTNQLNDVKHRLHKGEIDRISAESKVTNLEEEVDFLKAQLDEAKKSVEAVEKA